MPPKKVRLTAEDDVMYLRQKEGMTTGKLSECVHLLELLGNPTPAEAEKMVISALDELVSDERIANKINALLVTLNIEDAFSTDDPRNTKANLTDRQHAYAAKLFINHDTVKDWEKAAVKELLAALAGRPERVPINDTSDPYSHPGDYTVKEIDLQMLIGEDLTATYGLTRTYQHHVTNERWELKRRSAPPWQQAVNSSTWTARFDGLEPHTQIGLSVATAVPVTMNRSLYRSLDDVFADTPLSKEEFPLNGSVIWRVKAGEIASSTELFVRLEWVAAASVV